MTAYNGKVVDGEIIVDGATLPEGATVKVFVPDDGESFELTPAQLDELDAAITSMDRGADNTDELILERIRSLMRGEP